MTSPVETRYRNFDALRLVMASAVVFSHSFLLAEHTEANEPFVQLLGEKNIAGLYGVFGFFAISGFLVTRSFVNRVSWRSYLANRSLRIFPGLAVAAAACAFVVGPIVTELSVVDYFTSRGTYGFVARTSLLANAGGIGLPGVEFWRPDGTVVMGTLWTLRPEFLCYLAVLAAGAAGVLRLPTALLAVAVGLWTHTELWSAGAQLGYLGVYFAAGSALFFIHQRQRPGAWIVGLSGVGLLVTAALGAPHEGFAVFGALLLIQLATTERIRLPDAARFGDLSYGIYLYGWPVQATLVWATDGRLSWLALFTLSLPLSAGCAWLSWHTVEARALTIARRYRDHERRRVAGAEADPAPVLG